MEKLGIVIQARMRSSRLYGKVLMRIEGKPILLFLIDMLRSFALPAQIVVATSEDYVDDKIEGLCFANNIQCLRGNEKDVFERFCRVAERYQFDHIVRLTGDNPIPHKQVIKTCLAQHLREHPDLTSTREILSDHSVKRYLPKGLSVDVINCGTLLKIDKGTLNDFEREHVIPVFFNQPFTVSLVKRIKNFQPPDISLSIDDLEDFRRVAEYIQNPYCEKVFL